MPDADPRLPTLLLIYLGFLTLISLTTTIAGYASPWLIFGEGLDRGGAVVDFYATRNLAVLVLCGLALFSRQAGLVFAAILVRLIIGTVDLGFLVADGIIDAPSWLVIGGWLTVFTVPQMVCLWALRDRGSGRTLAISEAVSVAQPPEVVWSTLQDHRGMPQWVRLGLRKVELFADGHAREGEAGSLRQIHFVGWPPVMERFLSVEAGRGYSYAVIGGMPQLRDHLGAVTLDAMPGGTRVTWTIRFVFHPLHPLSFAAPLFVAGFRQVVRAGLSTLRSMLEAR